MTGLGLLVLFQLWLRPIWILLNVQQILANVDQFGTLQRLLNLTLYFIQTCIPSAEFFGRVWRITDKLRDFLADSNDELVQLLCVENGANAESDRFGLTWNRLRFIELDIKFLQ